MERSVLDQAKTVDTLLSSGVWLLKFDCENLGFDWLIVLEITAWVPYKYHWLPLHFSTNIYRILSNLSIKFFYTLTNTIIHIYKNITTIR